MKLLAIQDFHKLIDLYFEGKYTYILEFSIYRVYQVITKIFFESTYLYSKMRLISYCYIGCLALNVRLLFSTKITQYLDIPVIPKY